MLSIAALSAWRRRARLTGTVVAIALGVAFLVGTMILGDTFAASFDRLFTDTAAGTDVVVRNATSVSDEPDAQRGYIDASIVEQVHSDRWCLSPSQRSLATASSSTSAANHWAATVRRGSPARGSTILR